MGCVRVPTLFDPLMYSGGLIYASTHMGFLLGAYMRKPKLKQATSNYYAICEHNYSI